ncbi:MAG TPA: CocE/NonD family hydrolase [Solirubrobacteraceae bacterium]|nr:CocE/NonD family hydrolase [Solirubrobacteraceae bacterium]
MLIDYDVAVTMSDGARIYADVFRPDGCEPVPAIVCWGPYGKHAPVSYDLFPNHGVEPGWVSAHAGFEAPDPVYWCAHGYAVVNVDPRGMWNSDGDATFYSAQETRDACELIEWVGTRPWCTGRVGMSGVSYLAIIQWHVAAQRPAHLAAINPWEGLSDRYRELAYHGGIPEDRFGPMWRERRVAFSRGRVEDTVANYAAHPLFDDYWQSRTPQLSAIVTPALVVASWSDQGLHTRGTIEGFRQIASEHKWLLIHGRKKWQWYYRPESVELLRAFFDQFLRGVDRGVQRWPRVRFEVRDRFYVGEWEQRDTWPPADVSHRALHLDLERGALSERAPQRESEAAYDAREGSLTLEHRFAADTAIVGSMKLRLWVRAEGSDDMDLFVAVRKLDRSGEPVGFSFFNSLQDGPVALGWLRVSHRELDPERSTPERPWHPHRSEARLAPGETVPVEIEIWPSGTRFSAGESLRLVIQGHDTYRYPPHIVCCGHSRTRNAGAHVVLAGGRFDSHVLLPVLGNR